MLRIWFSLRTSSFLTWVESPSLSHPSYLYVLQCKTTKLITYPFTQFFVPPCNFFLLCIFYHTLWTFKKRPHLIYYNMVTTAVKSKHLHEMLVNTWLKLNTKLSLNWFQNSKTAIKVLFFFWRIVCYLQFFWLALVPSSSHSQL